MGFFTKPEGSEELEPLSTERITASFDARDARYVVDDDGDVAGRWEDHLFYFFTLGNDGEILQSRGRWARSIGPEHLAKVLEITNEWNAEKIWPKSYVRVEGTDGEELGIYAEVSTDLEHGATDEQVDQLLGCGIASSLQFFAQLDEAFPEAVAAYQAQHPED